MRRTVIVVAEKTRNILFNQVYRTVIRGYYGAMHLIRSLVTPSYYNSYAALQLSLTVMVKTPPRAERKQPNLLNEINMKKNSIEDYLNYGLDSIDETRTIEVNLKSLLLIYKTIGELISFFHQEGHYKNIEDVREYIGDKKLGMLAILCKINYQDYENLLPQEVKDILESDEFYSPIKQYYKTK